MDEELRPLLSLLPELDFESSSLTDIRSAVEAAAASEPDDGLAVSEQAVLIPCSEGTQPVPLLIYRPLTAMVPMPIVLHIHGGGYVVGSARGSRSGNRLTAATLNAIVVSVDYRLAPETRHPGPLCDCYAALEWIHANARALTGDASRIAVMGESAGGGLAAALALLARDRREVSIVHQHLIYPMLDDRSGDTIATVKGAGEYVWTAASNRFAWRSLLGEDRLAPYGAAARADNLTGLPSTFISVGALDLFAHESIEYARRLLEQGVPVELHVYPGAFHGFDLSPTARVAVRARRNSMEALARALDARSPSLGAITP